MLGYRWYFGEDDYGKERLMFECRANPELVDFTKPKLFWVLQFCYCFLPLLYIIGLFLLLPNAVRIDWRGVLSDYYLDLFKFRILCQWFYQFLLLLENFILYIFVYLVSSERQNVLKTRLGMDFVRKLELGSIVSHY